MKQGVNRMDLIQITKLTEEGATTAQISKITGIAEDVVKKFMPVVEADDNNGSKSDFE